MNRTEVERILFCYISNDEDADAIAGLKAFSYNDFGRLLYILLKLRFYDLLFDFWHEHYEQFRENIMEDNDLPEDSELYMKKCAQWLTDYTDSSTNKEIREILKEIFDDT